MAAKLQNTWIFPNGLIGSVGCKNKKQKKQMNWTDKFSLYFYEGIKLTKARFTNLT